MSYRTPVLAELATDVGVSCCTPCSPPPPPVYYPPPLAPPEPPGPPAPHCDVTVGNVTIISFVGITC